MTGTRMLAVACGVVGLLAGAPQASTQPASTQQAPTQQAPTQPAPAQQAPTPAPAAPQSPPPDTDPQRPKDAGQSAQNAPIENETNAAWNESIQRGLQWLASVQNADGSFGRGRLSGNAGIVSLCGLAFMADGNMPGRGRYGEVVQRALEYVLSHVTESGLVYSEGVNGPMYGHGFAALFLGEVYGMTPEDTRVRDALVRAVRLIENSQNDEGGWRYQPVPYDADVSVTICQVMALRSARNAGIEIPKDVIDGAVRYMRECQNPDGGFRYMRNTGASGWPRTAAGVASLFYAGVYDDDSIPRGLAYLRRVALPDGGGAAGQPYYYYGHYYAAQAMYLAGGEWWKEWWPRIRDELVDTQQPDGSWLDQQWGQPLGTSMSLIIMQMPKRYLPIFQK